MTAYRFTRVTGPQNQDGYWPGEALSPSAGGQWKTHGAVAVFTGNGQPPVEGFIYPGTGHLWAVVVNPTPAIELPDSPEGK